jgi:hypothetical protein
MESNQMSANKPNTYPIPEETNPNDRIFSLLGKIFFGVIILAVLIGVGFYLGRFYSIKSISIKVTTPSKKVMTTVLPTQETFPQKQTINMKIEEKNYSAQAPLGWQFSQEKNVDSVTDNKISNGQVSLIIRTNMATEAPPCGFKDSPVQPSEMFSEVSAYTYDSYKEFTGSQGELYRRVDITANPSAGKSFFAICEKKGTAWSEMTSFGFITYEIPYSDNPEQTSIEILSLLDSMVASLKLAN